MRADRGGLWRIRGGNSRISRPECHTAPAHSALGRHLSARPPETTPSVPSFVKMTDRMTAFVAENNDTPIQCEIVRRGAGAGETDCFECEGTGDWTPFHPDPQGQHIPCRDCK